jgi:hypothetical protein
MSDLRSYNVSIELENADRINLELAQINKGLKGMRQEASNMQFDDATKSLNALKRSIAESAKAGNDVSKQLAAYDKGVKALLDDLSKQATLINYSMTEQGKADRARIKALKERSDLTKDEAAELRALQKTVIEGTDEELAQLKAKNKLLRLQAKQNQEQLKAETRERKTLKTLLKEDLKGITDRIKKQKEFIASLKTTEGRYKALKKAGSMALKGGMAVGGLAAAGIAGAVSAADRFVEDEAVMRRMKGPFSERDRRELLTRMRIETGADANAIVDAVNRVTSTLKGFTNEDVVTAAKAELEFPGAAALFQASTREGRRGKEYERLNERLRLLQQKTGVSLGDAMDAARRSRLGGNRWSQMQYVTAYAALQGSSAFAGNQEAMERALNAFLRKADPSKDLGEQLKTFKWDAYVWRAQDKNAVRRGIESIPGFALSSVVKEGGMTTLPTSAETTAMKLREMQLKKDELLLKFVPIASKLMDKLAALIDNGTIDKLADALVGLVEWLANRLGDLASLGATIGKGVASAVAGIGNFIKGDDKRPTDNSRSTTQESNGGIAFGRSIVGERGPELVIPLDYARSGRAAQVVQNFTQTFNMAGNQTTGQSLGQAVRRGSFGRSFIDARATW